MPWSDLLNIDGLVNSIFYVGTTNKNEYLPHQTLLFTIKQHLRIGNITYLINGTSMYHVIFEHVKVKAYIW